MRSLLFDPGRADTRLSLGSFNQRPAQVLLPWLALALSVTIVFLAVTGLVATLHGASGAAAAFPGIDETPTIGLAFSIFGANLLALALHAAACTAAFVAGSSSRVAVGRHRVRLVLCFIVAATAFALIGQAWRLGDGAAGLAAELHTSPWLLLVGLSPHALPELTAIFLPFAAWTLAAKRDRWHELGAAALVTVSVAVPVLLVCALVETFVTSRVLLHVV